MLVSTALGDDLDWIDDDDDVMPLYMEAVAEWVAVAGDG